MATRTSLADAATAAGAAITEIPRNEAWLLLQAWREIYCAPVREATGKWVRGGLSWHTFSHDYFPSVRGRHALDQYHAQDSAGLLVLPESDHEIAIRCTSSSPVDFLGLNDVYIAPSSFEWTMVFTHEHPEYGPYFAGAEWRDRTGSNIR
jgi:hypothetical protein